MPEESPEPKEIVCHSSKWYLWRRVIPLSALPLFMSLYFFYDWKIGYPKDLVEYEEYKRFEQEGRLDEWPKYSAEKGYPTKPGEMTQEKIDGQFRWGVGVGILGLAALVYYLLNKPKKLRADETSLTTPWGTRIPFAAVKRIDKRKWDHKGLAYLTYTADGRDRRAVIDDLRFTGADQILKRVEELSPAEVLVTVPRTTDDGTGKATEGEKDADRQLAENPAPAVTEATSEKQP